MSNQRAGGKGRRTRRGEKPGGRRHYGKGRPIGIRGKEMETGLTNLKIGRMKWHRRRRSITRRRIKGLRLQWNIHLKTIGR